MKNEKSPIKTKRKRLPGQSLDEQLKDRALDGLLGPLFLATVFVAFAVMEWSRVLLDARPQPVVMTVAALVAIVYAGYKFWRHVPELKRLKLAREGEREVAEILDSLRESGYRILNDLQGSTFNIDHVVVGPSGVYTVETKTRMKPMRGNVKVVFDGTQILVDGRPSDRDPVIQARAQAGGLRAVLRDAFGRDFPVRAAVVFPGWWVETTTSGRSDIWVLNPKQLVAYIRNEPGRLSDQDVHLTTDVLTRIYSDRESP